MPNVEHLSAHHAESYGVNRLNYNSAAGVFFSSGETKELYAFLSSMKPSHINTFLGGTVTIQQLDVALLVYRTGEVGKFWTTTAPASPWQHALEMAMPNTIYPSQMKEIPNYHPANKQVLVYKIPAGQVIASGKCAPLDGFPGQGTQIYIPRVNVAEVEAISWSSWVEMQRSIKNSKPIVTIDTPTPSAKMSGGKTHKSLLGANIVANICEYESVAEGLGATVGQTVAMGAVQVLAGPLRAAVLPLTLMGALPDVRATYDATVESLAQVKPDIPEMSESQKVNNILMWGNPWGPGRGLINNKMTPQKRAEVVLCTDPETFASVPLQIAGQKINSFVFHAGNIVASVVAMLNPLSTNSKLYAPDRYRVEDQPGYAFIDALRWTETKTHYQPNLAEEACLRMIGDILAANQAHAEPVSLPPIADPINPQQLALQATFAPGYQGPKFKFENNRMPTWVKGVGIAASAAGWKVSFTTQLSWAFLGAGGVVLVGGGIVGYFARKNQQSKQNIRARNSRRVEEQCSAINAEIDKLSQKIDNVIALGNRYLAETNVITKEALYTEFTQTITTLKAENKALQDLNAERTWNKDLHVDGHKIRKRTRDYCKTLVNIFTENASTLDELENKIVTHQNETLEIAEINRKAQRAFDEKQRVSNILSITSDVAAIAKNTLTLLMPEKPKPVVTIPMTKSDHVPPAHISLWQAPRKQEMIKNDIKKLPASVSGNSSPKPQPIKAFKL